MTAILTETQKALNMEQQNAVRTLLNEMRVALANPDGMPQWYVDQRVVNLSNHLATFATAQSDPFDWEMLANLRINAGY